MSTAIGHGEIPDIGLPQRLLLARAHAHLNQTELAALMGVSRKTVANAETGLKTPLTMTLRAWAHATGVDTHWLQTGETPTGSDPDGGLESTDLGLKVRSYYQLSYRGDAHLSNVHPIDFAAVA